GVDAVASHALQPDRAVVEAGALSTADRAGRSGQALGAGRAAVDSAALALTHQLTGRERVATGARRAHRAAARATLAALLLGVGLVQRGADLAGAALVVHRAGVADLRGRVLLRDAEPVAEPADEVVHVSAVGVAEAAGNADAAVGGERAGVIRPAVGE